MYCRHKPGSDWKVDDEYPDFSKIKSDQSLNWSSFSKSFWVRYNDNKNYLEEYGVIGYSVNTILNTHKKDSRISQGIFGIKHKSCVNNYSHCELYPKQANLPKSTKQAFRLALKINCIKALKPGQKVSSSMKIIQSVCILWHRIIIMLK